jgi:hypothetical protein
MLNWLSHGLGTALIEEVAAMVQAALAYQLFPGFADTRTHRSIPEKGHPDPNRNRWKFTPISHMTIQ